jgi:ribosomal protein L11 methyltransferase
LGKTWPALDIHVPGCDPQLQDLVLAELDDFQPTAIQHLDDTQKLRAFFTKASGRDSAARGLAVAFGTHLFVEPVDIDDEDWAARSQAQIRAVTIGRLVIAPPWDVPDETHGAHVVVIRPSTGFGTGHHATTRLALGALQSVDLTNRTVLDIGCGSGVLAIAGVSLGARSALGVDIDSDALANARENAELNDVAGLVRFEELDLLKLSSPADVVLANLTGGLIERSASALAALVASGGYLIVSGFMDTEKEVVPTLKRLLTLQNLTEEQEWRCAAFTR